MNVKEHDLTPQGWTSKTEVAPGIEAVHYPDGTIRIRHLCKIIFGEAYYISPALTPGASGHKVISTKPLTITPSILCPDCGLHGFIENGAWHE